MWLNMDWRRIALNGICNYIPEDDIRSACEEVQKEAKQDNKSDTPTFSVRFIGLVGHLYSVKIPLGPLEMIRDLKELLFEKLTALVNEAAKTTLKSHDDLVAALAEHGLTTQDIVLKGDDCSMLLEFF